MKSLVIFLLISFLTPFLNAQEDYNSCNEAFEICPQQLFSINNLNSNSTFCPDCEDDFTFCFTPTNSIWLTFTTNEIGGDVQLDFSNLVFETNPGQDTELHATLIQANIPCNSASYTQIGNCVTNASGNFSLNSIGLAANTTFYVVISGDDQGVGITSSAEFTADVILSGTGVNRPTPGIAIATNSPICEGEIVDIAVYLDNCPDSSLFHWYVNGTLTAITSENFFLSSEINDGDVVTVETTCFQDCIYALSVSSNPISVISFSLDAGEDVVINEGESVFLNGQTSAADYFWTPSFSLSNDTILAPIAFPTETTTYSITASQDGCVLIDYVTVVVDDQLFFPNTFSPNGDGENDTWEIIGIEKYPDCQLIIFNRWGQEVFQSTGYNKDKAWNGEGKIGALNEGVYFYEINLRDTEKRKLNGSITLIR